MNGWVIAIIVILVIVVLGLIGWGIWYGIESMKKPAPPGGNLGGSQTSPCVTSFRINLGGPSDLPDLQKAQVILTTNTPLSASDVIYWTATGTDDSINQIAALVGTNPPLVQVAPQLYVQNIEVPSGISQANPHKIVAKINGCAFQKVIDI